MITMLATLCHLATISPGIPPIEFCKEEVIGRRDADETDDNVGSCYVMAQMVIAPRLLPGYTVKSIRCAKGDERPRDAI